MGGAFRLCPLGLPASEPARPCCVTGTHPSAGPALLEFLCLSVLSFLLVLKRMLLLSQSIFETPGAQVTGRCVSVTF